MSRSPWLIDAAIAIVLAAFVLIVSPGLAVTGMLAGIVLLVCAITVAFEARRRRRSTIARSPSRRRGRG